MVGVGAKSTCTGCHAKGEAGYAAASQMADGIGGLTATIAEADRLLNEAERAGMEVSPDRFDLQQARDKLIEARVLVHSFDLDRFKGVAAEGLGTAEKGIAAGHRAFDELRFRRFGLALSFVVIAAVILALVLTIRRLERWKDA
jgi:hypothetical protein